VSLPANRLLLTAQRELRPPDIFSLLWASVAHENYFIIAGSIIKPEFVLVSISTCALHGVAANFFLYPVAHF